MPRPSPSSTSQSDSLSVSLSVAEIVGEWVRCCASFVRVPIAAVNWLWPIKRWLPVWRIGRGFVRVRHHRPCYRYVRPSLHNCTTIYSIICHVMYLRSRMPSICMGDVYTRLSWFPPRRQKWLRDRHENGIERGQNPPTNWPYPVQSGTPSNTRREKFSLLHIHMRHIFLLLK